MSRFWLCVIGAFIAGMFIMKAYQIFYLSGSDRSGRDGYAIEYRRLEELTKHLKAEIVLKGKEIKSYDSVISVYKADIAKIGAEKVKFQRQTSRNEEKYKKIIQDFSNKSISVSGWDSIFSRWYPEEGRRDFSSITGMESAYDSAGHR